MKKLFSMKYIAFTTIFFMVFTLFYLFGEFKNGKVPKDTFIKLVLSYLFAIVGMVYLIIANW